MEMHHGKSAFDALSIALHDPKALFRRGQAYESIGKYQEAFGQDQYGHQ